LNSLRFLTAASAGFLRTTAAPKTPSHQERQVSAVWIEPRYEAEVAEPLAMTLQILFGVVGMSMWLTP
jgi:hypothetical protein